MATTTDNEPHALYRFYGAGGTLLYIGITNSIPVRLKKHNADKAWWTGVADIKVEHYPNRAAVLEAERRAIIAEKPLYNVQHNQGGRWVTQEPLGRTPELIAVCMGCHVKIDGSSAGALHISHLEVGIHQRYVREQNPWSSGIDVEELLSGPSTATWMVHCDFCNPHWTEDGDGVALCDSCYCISTNEVRTWSQLVQWTAHLQEKAWLVHTNWFGFTRAIALGAHDAGFISARAAS